MERIKDKLGMFYRQQDEHDEEILRNRDRLNEIVDWINSQEDCSFIPEEPKPTTSAGVGLEEGGMDG